MISETMTASWRNPPLFIPLIAAIPALFALTTVPQLSSIWPGTDFNRFFSIPVTLVELIVITLTVLRGIDLLAPLRGEKPWVWAALIILCLVAFGTAQFVAIDQFTAWLRTLAWGVHLLFGFSVAGLAKRYWVGRAREIWWWILGGLLVHLAMVAVFVVTMPDPEDYPWQWFGFSAGNIRQLGYYSSAGFSIAMGIAIMAKVQRTRWAAVVVAALMIALTFWSGTRSSLLSSIAALLAASVVCREARTLRSIKLSLTALVLGAGLSFVHIAPDPAMGFWRIFKDSARGDANGISSGRMQIWMSTARTITKRPVFGYGESEFKIVEPSVRGTIYHPHNSILQFLFQWGLVGASCFFGLMALLVMRLLAVVRNNPDTALPAGLLVASTLATSLIDGSLYHPYPVMMAVFVMVCALACLANASQTQVAKRPLDDSSPLASY